jgi:glycosyltransferase involved in cell wall biosynthesis
VRIALDATYSIDPHPSGIAVYSREILEGLAAAHPQDEFIHCYRAKQFRQAGIAAMPNAWRRLLLPPLPTFRAEVFHALNQRVDARPAKKVVSTVHDLFVLTGEYSSPEFRARFAQQARRAAENSDLLIAVSEFTADQVSAHLGFDRSRIRVIPHGVNRPPPQANGHREKLILFVGALQVRKNVARLVEAFESLQLEPTMKDWRLTLAGARTGYGAAAILSRIENSVCRERIDVRGYLSPEALERLYARASIFAFPSLDEGFGIPVLEAMAHGIPVVTSNCSALPEVAGEAALLVSPRSSTEIADALKRLVNDAELRKRLEELGRARADLYPWHRAVSATYEVYRELQGSAP